MGLRTAGEESPHNYLFRLLSLISQEKNKVRQTTRIVMESLLKYMAQIKAVRQALGDRVITFLKCNQLDISCQFGSFMGLERRYKQ